MIDALEDEEAAHPDLPRRWKRVWTQPAPQCPLLRHLPPRSLGALPPAWLTQLAWNGGYRDSYAYPCLHSFFVPRIRTRGIQHDLLLRTLEGTELHKPSVSEEPQAPTSLAGFRVLSLCSGTSMGTLLVITCMPRRHHADLA